jgi:parvulin-like peptidyl-prolyl isomerase
VTRTLRLLAVSAVAAVALTGCGDGTVRTGAAATVGNDRISDSTLSTLVKRSLAAPGAAAAVGADKVAFERSALTRLLQHLLLTRAARDENVTVTATAVDTAFAGFASGAGGEAALQDQANKAGIAGADLRGAIADAVLRDALGDKLTESIQISAADLQTAYTANIAQFDQVHSAHILVAKLATAQQILARVKADPTTFAKQAALYSSDTSNKDKGGDLGFQGKGALAKPFEDAIFANKPGSFVIAHTTFGFHVIHVLERKTTSLDEATPMLRRQLLSDQRGALLKTYLQRVAKKLGVHVNPRFGSWNAADQTVSATADCPATTFSTPSPRPGDTAPAAAPTGAPAC